MAKTIVPIADLRSEPVELLPKTFDHHPMRDSQILFNEEVEILEIRDEWLRIAAVEQLVFTPKLGWCPYEGWIRREELGEGTITPKHVVCVPNELPYGAYVDSPLPGTRPLSERLNRKQLIEEAMNFLGTPYLWGGRSSYFPGRIASVDCSGLVNLLYHAQGISIPRNAHDQFLFGRRIGGLEPGDALYLARIEQASSEQPKAERMHHVILKLENDLFIEAPETGKKVRLLKLDDTIWKKGEEWHIFDRPAPYKGVPISFEKASF